MTYRGLLLFCFGLASCGPSESPLTAESSIVVAANCPNEPIRSDRPPGTAERHRSAEFWIDGWGVDADGVLLDEASIALLNRSAFELSAGPRSLASTGLAQVEGNLAAVSERLRYMAEQIDARHYVEGHPGSFETARVVVSESAPLDHVRLVLHETQLYCIPLDSGLYTIPVDRAFDRNACATLHPGEALRILRRSRAGDWLYARAEHTVGWVHPEGVGPRLSTSDAHAWERPTRVVSHSDEVVTEGGFRIRAGVSLPIVAAETDAFAVLRPAEAGLRVDRVERGHGVAEDPRPLTRRRLFEAAFGMLDDPYGWGGYRGDRDCSSFLRDLFASFGVALARHSGVQALQGSRSIDVSQSSEAEKLQTIAREAELGVLLLYMPGHIMLYLGQDENDHYALSSISEWLEPCPAGPDTIHRIDRVEVTTLELGRGTGRSSFLERLTRIVVFGPATSPTFDEHPPTAQQPLESIEVRDAGGTRQG